MDEGRTDREAAFHDEAFATRTRQRAARYYAAARGAKAHYLGLVLGDGSRRTILEYGCGTGSAAFDLASAARERGGGITGIDVSEVGLRQARQRAQALGLGQAVRFLQMDAEHLRFPDRHFDLVCGSGILHHLDLDRALAEVRRVLKPDGAAVFFEPLAHNPLIRLYRRLTPALRTPDEHPLTVSDLRRAAAQFASADLRFFGLLALGAVALHRRPGFERALRLLEALDRRLLSRPWLQRHAWIVVLHLRGPQPTAGGR